VQVPCDEGVANHIGPESRAVAREDLGEALTGERIGQPLSRERVSFWVPTPCTRWKATVRARQRERPADPAWSETLACADAPCVGTGRSRDRPFGKGRRSASERRGAVADDVRSREVRLCHSSLEADEQSGPGRSRAGGAKAGAKGSASQQSTDRAQNRTIVSQALDRIRKVAKERKKERFTALLHHVSIDLLDEAFNELIENAAAGVDGVTWRD
jgi:hypothetical protein